MLKGSRVFRHGSKKLRHPTAVGWGGAFHERNCGPRIESALEADLCRMVGIKYFGILLYHRLHKRIQFFAQDQLAYLDAISGSNLMMFVPAGVNKTPPRLKSLLDRCTDDVRARFQSYMAPIKPFDPDACFIIAEALDLKNSLPHSKGSVLPCIVFFRVNKKSTTVLGSMKLRDNWFPASKVDQSRLNMMREFFREMFDELNNCISRGDRNLLERFQVRLQEMKRSAEFKIRYLAVKGCAVQIINASSRRIIKSLPQLIERSVMAIARKDLGI